MDLLNIVDTFRKKRNWDKVDSPSVLAKSIVVEAAELLEHFQFSETDYDKKQVCGELADVLMYAYAMCIELNVTPDQIVLEKLDDVAKRYPEVHG